VVVSDAVGAFVSLRLDGAQVENLQLEGSGLDVCAVVLMVTMMMLK
jgi:hypothetical protein